MLHKVHPPDYYPQLEAVLEFQASVIRYACTPPVNLTLDQLKNTFGEEAGDWFWERLVYNKKETAFCAHLRQLIDYVTRDASIGIRIIGAFSHDRNFNTHLDDEAYRFSQVSLPQADKDALGPFMVDFYEKLFDQNGFPSTIYGVEHGEKIDRSLWNDAFWTKNKGLDVCPACDDQRPARIKGHITSQVNHFLPKETYPFYSIHPGNLVPVCYACNAVAQGRLDPIDDHSDSPLVNTFHPYFRPAIDHILVTGSTTPEGVFQVVVSELDGNKSRRVNRMVRLLDLEARWADRIESLINLLIESSGVNDKESFEESLHDRYDQLSTRAGAEPNAYLYRKLINFLFEHPDEIDTLWDVIGT